MSGVMFLAAVFTPHPGPLPASGAREVDALEKAL